MATTTPSSNTPTASHRHAHHGAAIQDKLKAIQEALFQHTMEFEKTGRRNFGYVGDLAHVSDELGQILAFLNNDDS